MDEYIEKQKVANLLVELKNEFQQFKPFEGFEHAMYRKLCEAEITIGKLPAADVSPVMRCKDCVHYDLGVCLKIYSDGNTQKDSWQSRNPDDFCSYGERKDGGADHEDN